jgi:hypothetical protein
MIPFALSLLLAPSVIGTSNAPDTEPPIIEDLAAAAANPAAAPVITVMLTDNGTGVGNAFVYYRGPGQSWSKAELKGGTSGLFIARLPDGLQRSGFDYYVEATDVAGNGPSRIGSPEAPIHVERATLATLDRLAREPHVDAKVNDPVRIHPAWMMLSLAVGVLAGGGAAAYGMDLVGVNKNIAIDENNLADPNLSQIGKTKIVDNEVGLKQAATQDTVIAAILGVVGAAGIVTGAALVGVTEFE